MLEEYTDGVALLQLVTVVQIRIGELPIEQGTGLVSRGRDSHTTKLSPPTSGEHAHTGHHLVDGRP